MRRFLRTAAVAAAFFAAAIGLGVMAEAAPIGAAMPSAEGLLAAGLSAADLQAAHLPPGGWFDTGASFNGNLEPKVPPQLLSSVSRLVEGGPAETSSDVSTVVTVYSDPQGATADFARRAPLDQKNFGNTVAGPQVGDQARYMRSQPAAPSAPGSSPEQPGFSLRVVDGRYMFRIDVDGKAAALSPETMAGLAHVVMGHLSELDAGRLAVPALPAAAAVLPDADNEFNPIMGNAIYSAVGQAYTWPAGAKEPVISPRLRDLLLHGVTNAQLIVRAYALASHRGEVVYIELMPFTTSEAAAAFEEANQQLNPPGPGSKTEGGLTVKVRGSGHTYLTNFQRGRYAVEVACYAPFGDTAVDCEQAARDMAGKVTARVAAQRGSP